MDDWLRARWTGPAPDLAAVGVELLSYGITGVTDATATTRPEDAELLAGAVASGAIPQYVQLTGGLDLDPRVAPSLPRGGSSSWWPTTTCPPSTTWRHRSWQPTDVAGRSPSTA
jgi:hypothetical protein